MLKFVHRGKPLLLFMISCAMIVGLFSGTARAEGEGASYNYSYWGLTVASPAAYVATDLYTGSSLGIDAFRNPGDIHVTPDNMIYLLDSGNNRIIVMDERFQVVHIVESFVREGEAETFNNPQGIFVNDRKHVIVADTGNKRVVHLDENYRFVKFVQEPESELLTASFQFQPVRVVMDSAQRIYVMSIGVFDGFMEFNADGAFTSFIGANRVNVDPVEYFWKRISTKAQRAQMIMFTPTEFTNLDIDDEGFIYATNGDQWGQNIKKLNAQGNDILRRTGYYDPQGDIRYSVEDGRARMIDIDVTDSEIYSVLDQKRGRIFTYNGDGHLMYVFGGIGNQLGKFNTPTAIARLGDNFIVLDKALGEMTLFRTTEYGRALNEAVRSYYRGDEEAAFEWYSQITGMNANLEFAYAGIGKALLRQGDYDDAVVQFRQSMDQANYSKAFLLLRKEIMREYFSLIMTAIVVIVIAAIVVTRLRKSAARRRGISL